MSFANRDITANVLLVDDREANLVALEAMLHDIGARLVKARSGQEALKRLLEDDYAVILLDVKMPGMDGYETARLIRSRERTKHTPIIFVTAYETIDDRVLQSYREGASDHLVKPLVPEILRAKVATFVELYEKSERLRQLERTDFEIRLAGEQQRLAAIVESSDDAIIGTSLAGLILSWNRGAERLFGYPADDIVGRSISTLAPPGHEEEFPKNLERIRRGEHIKHFETVRRTKDGRVLHVSLSISPIRDPAGKIIGISKIARDISDRKRLEEELRQRAEQLALADRHKDEFLAMLAHELRNPLAPITNAVQILRLRCGNDPHLHRVRDVVERQVQQMTRLVEDLLDMARIAKGKVHVKKQRVELSAVVPTAVEASRPLIEARQHHLEVNLADEPLWLDADPARLAQVITNLLNNAAKYTEPGGKIWLTAGREGDEVVVRVRDNGAGIPPEQLPQIFNLFMQLDRPLERSQCGMGIGLALVRGLVDLHGGRVEAHSDGPGQGSEFVVRLPAPAAHLPANGHGHGADQRANARLPTRRVLVVDDNADAAESLAMLLKFLGHEVRVLHEGAAVLDAVREYRPEVVILDIGLPGLDGYQVAQQIRAEPAGVADTILVALTGYGSDDDRRRSREAGFNYHLVKPVEPSSIQSILAQPAATIASQA